jgi:hypothetical protein
VTAVKSGKTEVGHSPSTGNALLAGKSGVGASVDEISAVVVVSAPDSGSDVTAELSASDDELHAIRVNATAAKAMCRETFIHTFSQLDAD